MRFGISETSNMVEARVINADAIVGTRSLLKVLVNDDIYYISKRETGECEVGSIVRFDAMRKDLIQVNDVIHADMLKI